MKRFISKKTIKLPKYKIIILKLLLVIILFLILNLFINKNTNLIYQTLNNNSFNIIKYHKSYNLTKYIFGFNINKPPKEDTNVTFNIPKYEKLVINKPLIYLYNTYQTSKYKINYFNTYTINWTITDACKILQDYLYQENIEAYVELNSVVKTLNEHNLAYTSSYKASRILLEQAKNTYNSLEYFFDIEISDASKDSTTTSIDNKDYAKILFVVGGANQNYLENKQLADNLNELLKKHHASLSRGVEIRSGAGYEGVYNQDFNPKTIQIYLGGFNNTIEEVNRTLKIFAQVIKEYKENADGN